MIARLKPRARAAPARSDRLHCDSPAGRASRAVPDSPRKGRTIAEPAPSPLTLTLVDALVASSVTPLLLLDGALKVVAASASFAHAFALDRAALPGQPLLAMGDGEWDRPQLRAMLDAVAGGARIVAYEFELPARGERGLRHLSLSAHRLDYDDPATVRLLVSVADQTEARAAVAVTERLLEEKRLLNRELQHRVANSLQIIASVLMQSAQRVGSDESRSHLQQAHNRVMSIAAVQKQLATTGADSVALRPYLTQLCASIAASMIPDPAKLSLDVSVDDSSVTSDISVSLGLIVTELVINALKHAFPDGRAGHIMVRYARDGDAWRLDVADDGVGMPGGTGAAATPGLGTSIVEALVRQRQARITLTPGHPGTIVSIRHDPANNAGADVLPLTRAV